MLRRTVRLGTAVACLMCLAPALARAQDTADLRRDDGLRLRNVSASADYFQQSIPSDIRTFDDVFLGSSSAGTAAATLGWRKTGPNGVVMLSSYSTYSVRAQGDTSAGWNEAVNGAFLKRVRRWSLAAGGNAAIMNFDESLFANSTMSTLASSNLTLPEVVDVVTGAPSVAGAASGGRFEADSNPGKFLLGRRTAAFGGDVTMAYSSSRRMTIDITSGISQIKRLQSSDVASVGDLRATAISVGANVSLSLTRDTELGVGGNVTKSESDIVETKSRAMSISINKQIARKYFMQGSIGYGGTTGNAAQNSTIYRAGGGVVARSHSFMGVYGRSVNSLYSVALGQDSSFFSSATASWNWSPRRAKWYVQSGYSHYRDQPARKVFTLPAPTSWTAQVTMARQVGDHIMMSAMYSVGRTGARRYVQDGRQYKLEQNAIRLTLSWSPSRIEPVRR